jgi:hypothetical protein
MVLIQRENVTWGGIPAANPFGDEGFFEWCKRDGISIASSFQFQFQGVLCQTMSKPSPPQVK